MQITTLSVRDFRGCREFECQPGERALVLVGGRNGAGKTSALNAIEWALLGPAAGPDEAVRRGADAAEVTVRMDGGAYTIMRRETAAGTRSFRVTAADGAVYPKPQAFLEKLIGTKFLDPVAFAAMKPAAQREALLKAVPVGIDLDANTAERKRAYEARTDVGRRLRDAEGEERALPEPVEPPTYEPETETSIADLMAALNAARGESDRQAGKRLALANAEHHHNRTEVEVDRLRRALAEAEAELVRSCALRDDLRAEVDAMTSPDVAAAERALAEVDETNRAIRARQAEHADIARRHREAAAARKAAAEKTSTLAGEQAALTARIEALDKARADALAAAAMPLPDLSVGDDGLLYRGLPFSQACDGERIRVSVAIAMALSPGLRDIIIRNGALLDEVGLATIAGQADAAGYRLWVERVGTGDPGAIVFVDGAALDAAA